MSKIKLFCFPYAGGSAAIYMKWTKLLNNNIEVIPVELPGRGKRFVEPLSENINEVVNDIFNFIVKHLDGTPYALFGYSMGSWIAFELIRKIKSHGHNSPIHAFFAAKEAPHIKRKSKNLHKLPTDEFSNEILKLGGTPREIFENEELRDIFITILKADYKIVETYNFTAHSSPLDCNITVFSGKEDEYKTEDIMGWQELTKKGCTIHTFDGGHFFIHDKLHDVVSIVNKTLIGQVSA